jgi:hypothetical protein
MRSINEAVALVMALSAKPSLMSRHQKMEMVKRIGIGIAALPVLLPRAPGQQPKGDSNW